jgi:hypothetical protein
MEELYDKGESFVDVHWREGLETVEEMEVLLATIESRLATSCFCCSRRVSSFEL